MRKIAAIWLGKSLLFITKLLRLGGGSAAPGLYALKIDPNLIQELVKDIPKSILVTGTNGKTTTSKLINHLALANGLKTIRNSTGSNLERGIASTLIKSSELGIVKADLAIWEIDEAAFNKMAPILKPDLIIFLNAFRDQLDRYGEVDSVVKNWGLTLKTLPKSTKILINSDDKMLLPLLETANGQGSCFKIIGSTVKGEHAPHTKAKITADFTARKLLLEGLDSTTFRLLVNLQETSLKLPLPGEYNVYNFLAAFGALKLLGYPIDNLLKTLESFKPAFGRFEKVILKNNLDCYVSLIKNPTGASEVFKTVSKNLQPEDTLLIALNDNFADGKDISWIWDADFEALNNHSASVYVSGQRALDMAVRLKYAGFDQSTVRIVRSLEDAFKQAQISLKGRLFILVTYTALLKLQAIFKAQGLRDHYWKDEY